MKRPYKWTRTAIGRPSRSMIVLLLLLPMLATSCIKIRHEITADVTVHLKVDRELDNFFGDIDKQDTTIRAEEGEIK